MKKVIFILIIVTYGCHSSNNHDSDSAPKTKYIFTLYEDKFDPISKRFKENNIVDTLISYNDTTAYLTALKTFYNDKVIERQRFNYGQPKSFIITDKTGIDLSLKLPERMVNGFLKQVKNLPTVKKMIDEYNADSLKTDTLNH